MIIEISMILIICLLGYIAAKMRSIHLIFEEKFKYLISNLNNVHENTIANCFTGRLELLLEELNSNLDFECVNQLRVNSHTIVERSEVLEKVLIEVAEMNNKVGDIRNSSARVSKETIDKDVLISLLSR